MSPAQRTRNKFAALAVVVFMAVFSLFGGIRLLNNSGAEASLATVFTSSKYDLRITKLENYPLNESTQSHRVRLTIEIVNKSDEAIPVTPGFQMQLFTDTGDSFPMTAAYYPPGVIIGGEIASKQTWIQGIDFDLPSDQAPAKFVFQTDAGTKAAEVGL